MVVKVQSEKYINKNTLSLNISLNRNLTIINLDILGAWRYTFLSFLIKTEKLIVLHFVMIRIKDDYFT